MVTIKKIRFVFAGLVLIASLGGLQAANITLAWDSPSLNEDGTPLNDLAGTIVHYGTEPGNYPYAVDVGNTNQAVLTGLEVGKTYYVAVEAYNAWNFLSDLSQEISATPASVQIDVDQDDMPDAWETTYFGGTATVGAEPDGDFDGDGYSNLEEYIAGTDPTGPASGPNLVLEIKNKYVTVSFEALQATAPTQRYYSLERTASLSNEAWLPVPGYEAILGADQVVSYVERTRKQGYYRLNVWLQ